MLRDALSGFVRRVVIQSPGIITNIGRRQRLFTGQMRHGGHTTPDNGAPLCDRHQKLKERGFTDHQQPDGTWTWHRPDSTRLE